MSRPVRGLGATSKILILVVVGLVGLEFTGSLFMLIFPPIVVYYIWGNYNKTRELERRLAALENLAPASKDERPPEKAS